MANGHRVVAELGRPETPEETADRKAESSRVYRSSQTTRNLVAALIVTVAVVAVIIFAVPRGSIPEQAPIDPATTAAELSDSLQRTLLVADAPEDWRVNSASLAGDDPGAWTVVYAPPTGFVTIAQGFDADEAWPSQLMGGTRSNGTVTVDGIVWDRYQVSDASDERQRVLCACDGSGTRHRGRLRLDRRRHHGHRGRDRDRSDSCAA